MIDSGPFPGVATTLSPQEEDSRGPSVAMQRVEERIRRLEDAVASLQEQRRPELPVILPLPEQPPRSAASDALLDTGRRLLPLAVNLLAPPVTETSPTSVSGARRPWLLVDAVQELRLMVAMFADRRYRVSWVAWVVPIAILFLMIGSTYVIGGIPFIGSILDKLVDLLLAFMVYKVLTREAARYRESLIQGRGLAA
jgi:hypothetical protein